MHDAMASLQDLRLLQSFLDALPQQVYIKDEWGRYVWVNQAVCRVYRREFADWIGKTAYDVVDEESAYIVSTYDALAWAREEPLLSEYDLKMPDGEVGRFQSYRFPFRTRDGDVLLAGVSLDLTAEVRTVAERDRLLEELANSRREALRQAELMKAILDNLVQGVTVIRPDGSVMLRNRVSQQLTGLDSGGGLARLKRSDGSPLPHGEDLVYPQTLQGSEARQVEYLLEPPGGGSTLIELNSTLVELEGREPLVIHSFQDVSALRRLELARQQYLRVMTHDLRSPLAVIYAAAEMAQMKGRSTTEVRELAARIRAAAHQIDLLLGDLADSATLEAGELVVRHEPVELTGIVHRLLADYQAVLPTERVAMSAPGGEVWLQADPPRLERMVLNLLSNALQYSEPDTKVEVRVESMADEAVLQVTDRGSGIADQDLPYLFAPYFRGAAGRTRPEGSGLGLFIVKGLVQAHGGRIWVAETGPGGTTMGMALPLEAAAPRGETPFGDAGQLEGGPRRRVLVVDDHLPTAELVERILSGAGLLVAVAGNGQEALARAAAAPPDLVLLDLFMPVMDGRRFVQEFRAAGYGAPVVLLTSSPRAEQVAGELGAAGVVGKPFAAYELLRAVKLGLGTATAAAPAGPAAPP